jgi:hypothetical protein
MGDLWNRYTRVTIGTVRITSDNLDIGFEVKGSNSSEKNTAEVVIYNLSRTTRAKITADLDITLEAGYADDHGTIFSGIVKKIYEERDGGDLKTHVVATTKGFATGKGGRKFTKSTPLKEIIQVAFEDSGIPIAHEIDDQGVTLNSDYTSEINAGDDIDNCKKLIDDAGPKKAKCYIEANGGYFVAADYAREEQVVISLETGLKETVPEDPDDRSYTRSIRSILNYRLMTDSQVLLKSQGIGASGTYKVVEYTHAREGTDTYETEVKVI